MCSSKGDNEHGWMIQRRLMRNDSIVQLVQVPGAALKSPFLKATEFQANLRCLELKSLTSQCFHSENKNADDIIFVHWIQIKQANQPSCQAFKCPVPYLRWGPQRFTSWRTWRGQSSRGSLPSKRWWLRSRPHERCNRWSHRHPSLRHPQAFGCKREKKEQGFC